MTTYYDIRIQGDCLEIYEDGLWWLYRILDGRIEEAAHIIDEAIGHWYNTEEYPEYHDECIGDVIDLELDAAEIKFEYLDGGEDDE